MSKRRVFCRFTMIELILVVAIIALLAAMILPVISKSRERSRRTTCAANLKQIGLTFHMYASDWDGHFGYVLEDENIQSVTNTLIVWNYMDVTDGWLCPSSETTVPDVEDTGDYATAPRGFFKDNGAVHGGTPYILYDINEKVYHAYESSSWVDQVINATDAVLGYDSGAFPDSTNHDNEFINVLHVDAHVDGFPITTLTDGGTLTP